MVCVGGEGGKERRVGKQLTGGHLSTKHTFHSHFFTFHFQRWYIVQYGSLPYPAQALPHAGKQVWGRGVGCDHRMSRVLGTRKHTLFPYSSCRGMYRP